MFLHNVVMTSVIVLARFLREWLLHFNSGNPTRLVRFYQTTVCQKANDGGGGCFTLAVGGTRSCVGLKQQTSITEHTQTILSSSCCAARVVFLHNVPDLKRIENILKRAGEG